MANKIRNQEIIGLMRNANGGYYSKLPSSIKEIRDNFIKIGESITSNPLLYSEVYTNLMGDIGARRADALMLDDDIYAELKGQPLEFGMTSERLFTEIAEAYPPAQYGDSAAFFTFVPGNVQAEYYAVNVRYLSKISIAIDRISEVLHNAIANPDNYDLNKFIDTQIGALTNLKRTIDMQLIKYIPMRHSLNGNIRKIQVADTPAEILKKIKIVVASMAYPNRDYNKRRVLNAGARKIYVMLPAAVVAKLEVDLEAGAFNMEKLGVEAKILRTDSFGTFENELFDEIKNDIELFTKEELEKTGKIQAFVFDDSFIEFRDKKNKITTQELASDDRIDHYMHIEQILGVVPFGQAAVITTEPVEDPQTIEVTLESIDSYNGYVRLGFSSTKNGVMAVSKEDKKENIGLYHDFSVVVPDGKGYKPLFTYNGFLYKTSEVVNKSTTLKKKLTLTKA